MITRIRKHFFFRLKHMEIGKVSVAIDYWETWFLTNYLGIRGAKHELNVKSWLETGGRIWVALLHVGQGLDQNWCKRMDWICPLEWDIEFEKCWKEKKWLLYIHHIYNVRFKLASEHWYFNIPHCCQHRRQCMDPACSRKSHGHDKLGMCMKLKAIHTTQNPWMYSLYSSTAIRSTGGGVLITDVCAPVLEPAKLLVFGRYT